MRPEAAREAREVKRLARTLDLPHRTLRWSGVKPKTGLPAAARAERYRLLAQAARSSGATHILTAHTRDDQAETLLMRMLRGSGIAGLDLADGDAVTEEQMKLLFGQGRHPRSEEPDAVARGWGALGRAFPTFAATTLRQEIATALSAHNTSQGRPWNAPIPTEERARIRSEVAAAVIRFTGSLGPSFVRFALARGRRLGLSGSIRDEDDTVVVTVEGPAALIDAFEITCSLGPIDSRIDAWTRSDAVPEEGARGTNLRF